MKYITMLLAGLLLFGTACEKEQNRKLLNAYLKYTINGTETIMTDGSGLNDNQFDAYIQGDTLLVVNASKLYEAVGFYIKKRSGITDGTYVLDSLNRAYYTNPKDRKRYVTNMLHTGSITIMKDTFRAKSVLNVLKGQFSFNAVDTLTGKTFALKEGAFLMERRE